MAATIFRASCARHRGEDGDAGAGDAERPARADLDRQHLDRIDADPAIDAQRVVAGPHRQEQRVADLGGGAPQRRICRDQQPRRPRPCQRQFRHLVADRVAAGAIVPLDDAFLDQHVDDAMHGRTGEAGRPHDLGQRHAVLAACGKNAQHRERAPDRLRALSRFQRAMGDFRRRSLVHNMDKNATIHSTGKARIWRLRGDRAPCATSRRSK
ncbi:hypothetical protein AB7M42_008347 [Bradyrhizobium diazoefficiens]